MIDQTVFLGLSESIWQGIFGFLSTIIVAGAVGFITIHWLSRVKISQVVNPLQEKITEVMKPSNNLILPAVELLGFINSSDA